MNSERSAEAVGFSGAGGDEIRALLIRPAEMEEDPRGVLLVPDGGGREGLEPFLRSVAQRLAEGGFVVLAPDLRASWSEDRRTLADLDAGAAFLAREAGVDARRTAACGFGRGGTLAFLFGCTRSRVGAVLMFAAPLRYPELSAAHPNQPLELALNLDAPLLAFFGTDDRNVPAVDVESLRDTLQAGGKHFEIVSRPGIGPRFLDAPSAPDVWERTLGFLRETL